MGLYKRGKTFWYSLQHEGRRYQGSLKTENKRRAEMLYLQAVSEIVDGRFSLEKEKTTYVFTDLSEEYLKWVTFQKAFRSKQGFVKHLVNTFGRLPLSEFKTRQVEQMQSDILTKGNKPATANRILAALKHMFVKAVEWEMVSEDVQKKVRKVKLLPENNRRLRYLSIEECHILLNSCVAHLRPVVLTALNTGMRKGEILNLQWRNVDLKNGFILLDETKNGERREIPINRTLRDTLRGLTRRIDVPYLFYDPQTGVPYKDVKRSFGTALRKANIKDFKFHDLRHTFASHLAMQGETPQTIQKLLGHSSITMTMRYTHLAPSHITKAVDLLDRLMNEECYKSATSEGKRDAGNPVNP